MAVERAPPDVAVQEDDMTTLSEAPISWIAAGLLSLGGGGAAFVGVRLMASGLRGARALDVVRGIRVLIIGFVAGVCALGIFTAESGFVVLAAIILAEELYETATLAAIIRLGG